MPHTRIPTDHALTPEELKPWVHRMHTHSRNVQLLDASTADGWVYFAAQDRDQILDAEPRYVRIRMDQLMQLITQCAVIGAHARKMVGPRPTDS